MSRKGKIKQKVEGLIEEAFPVEEQPYEVPENWTWVSLGHLSKVVSKGTTPPKSKGHDYTDEGVNFLRVENITKNRTLDLSKVKFINEVTHDSVLKRSKGEENDILISIAGALGRVAIIKKEHLPCNMNQAIAFIRLLNNKINHEYIMYGLSSPALQNNLLSQQKTTAQANLTLKNISEISIPLPPLKEQKRIADKVERLLIKIGDAKRLIEEAKETFEIRRAAILDRAFRGELTKKWREENPVNNHDLEQLVNDGDFPYQLPLGWKWKKLKDVVEQDKHAMKRGPFGSALKKEFFVKEGYKVYEQKNAIYDDFTIGTYYINEEKYKELEAFKVLPGDLIISCSGTIGKIAIAPQDIEEGVINQALLKISLNEDLINSQYFIELFRSETFNNQVTDNTRGTAIKNIASVKVLKELMVPVPSINEQREIVRILSGYDEKQKEILENLNFNTEQLKTSILNKAFRGELGTNDPTEESAIQLLKEVLQEQVK
ncbi:restriction endonuclease subunit S [Halalkalibacter sp. AB-rgal2]|uniref:restriction endonuclease subunit S n=1 Tax=Halalkalibacter sp. AB-rgal2 TaxID=3242695 RepID=UPI00359D470A